MKNIFIKSAAVLAACALGTGCIQETFPEGSTQTENQIKDSEFAFQGMLRAISSAMMSAGSAGYYNLYGTQVDFGMPAVHIMTESMLDDIAIQSETPNYYQFYMFLQNLGQGDDEWPVAYFWDGYYQWIKLANDIIALVDPETATDQEKVYLGQALTYRAMFYIDLARMYDPKDNTYAPVPEHIKGLTVPIVTEKTTEEQAMNNPRVPRETLYNDLILKDLEAAEQYLDPNDKSYANPTLAAVYGLYARAYLDMGYWTLEGDTEAFKKAAEYARKAIEQSGCSPLTQDQWENPQTGFNSGEANNAWIWGLKVSSDLLGNLIAFTPHMSTEALWGYGHLTNIGIDKHMYKRINGNDFRKHSWLDPNWKGWKGKYESDDSFEYDYKFAGTSETQGWFINGNAEQQIMPARPYQAIKFRPVGGEVLNFTNGNPADHPLMRVEEMYFIEMEAKAKAENVAAGENLLNEFMKTRVTDGSYNCNTGGDMLKFIDEMLFQKKIEFWGEGILFYDYKRLGKGIDRYHNGDTNHPAVWAFYTDGTSPQFNFSITRGETQSNTGIPTSMNNPDPSGKITVPGN